MRVLIADDNAQIRSALRLLLEEAGDLDAQGGRGRGAAELEGVEVLEASDAPALFEALDEARSSRGIDMILLDWELPGAVRPDLLEHIRTLPSACRVIAMSARPESRREAEGCGVDGFVGRSDPPEMLLRLLQRPGAVP